MVQRLRPSSQETMPESSTLTTCSASTPRARRAKTFTGCWTCRAKHVKCDENKPTCKRCEGAHVRWEGYDIRLSWTFLQDPSNFQAGRSPLRYRRRRIPSDFASNDSGAESYRSPPRDLGPFRLLKGLSARSQTCELSDSARRQEMPVNHVINAAPDADSRRGAPSLQGNMTQLLADAESAQVEDHAGTKPHEVTGQGAILGNQSVSSLESEPMSPEATSHYDISRLFGSRLTGQHAPHSPQFASAPGLRHMDILPDAALQCKLLEHWTLFLCDILAPIPGMRNPLRTIFTPLALEGAREDASVSTGAVALFHMICSASGFHMSKLESDPTSRRTFSNLGLEHHNLAITHLGQNIQSNDEQHYTSILASLIMCLYIESITIHNPSWRLHIRGAVDWLNHIEMEFWHRTESTAIIYQMFTCMAILIQSQILPGDRSGYSWTLRHDFRMQPQPYMLEWIFGIPQSILEVIKELNDMQQTAQQSQTSHEGVSNLMSRKDRLDRLELELLMMIPQGFSLSTPSDISERMHHHSHTYYYAALIYIRRTMKSLPIAEVRSLVGQALVHFEALQAISTQPSLPLLWPIAITAFEAQGPYQQRKVLDCLKTLAQKTGMALWNDFASSVRGLWMQRQTSSDPDLHWHAYSHTFYYSYMLI